LVTDSSDCVLASMLYEEHEGLADFDAAGR
jgi:hypothetical protein